MYPVPVKKLEMNAVLKMSMCLVMSILNMVFQQIWGSKSFCAHLTRIRDPFVFVHVFLIVAFTGEAFLTLAAPIVKPPCVLEPVLYHTRRPSECFRAQITCILVLCFFLFQTTIYHDLKKKDHYVKLVRRI